MEKTPAPRNYFLNEQHELTPTEADSGGRIRTFNGIDWADKGRRLHRSLSSARKAISESPDPMRQSRFFLAVLPEKELRQPSNAKDAKGGEKTSRPDFSKRTDGSSLRRLGLDVLSVAGTGEAVVHATLERFDQLSATSDRLAVEGVREKALWAALADIKPVPLSFRVDEQWLAQLPAGESVTAVFEFQPVLRATEADLLAREIRRIAATEHSPFEFDAAGTLFSGRKWYRAHVTPAQIRRTAAAFQSVQRIHQPHLTPLSLAARRKQGAHSLAPEVTAPLSVGQLPRVALVDAGVPADHPILGPFRQGQYANPDGVTSAIGSHGSLVASRLVYEGLQTGDQLTGPQCRFYDVNVASPETKDAGIPLIDEQLLVTALEAVVTTTQDIRVFNLSLGSVRPLAMESEIDRQEKLAKLSELDNFAVSRDAILVIAAGNSPRGVVPGSPYPDHLDDPSWALGHWACAFNALTVGAYVAQPNAEGVAKQRGAPSPFSLAGPSPIRSAPKPDLAAPGGDGAANYRGRPGLGVFGLNAEGQVVDCGGTSQSAPVISQIAARTVALLAPVCPPGAQPSAALVRATLALVAEHPAELPPRMEKAAKRTLGRGFPRLDRLSAPRQAAALVFWQGVIPDAKHKARVRIPVPADWVKVAASPRLRLVIAWLTPANSAFSGWACRKVHAALIPAEPADAPALGFKRVLAHGSYPVIERIFDLKSLAEGIDELILELRYEQAHEEPISSRPFSLETKVGVAVELIDQADTPVSPHAGLQAHLLIATATRLSVPASGIAVPITSS